jgi:hypothetical protein
MNEISAGTLFRTYSHTLFLKNYPHNIIDRQVSNEKLKNNERTVEETDAN